MWCTCNALTPQYLWCARYARHVAPLHTLKAVLLSVQIVGATEDDDGTASLPWDRRATSVRQSSSVLADEMNRRRQWQWAAGLRRQTLTLSLVDTLLTVTVVELRVTTDELNVKSFKKNCLFDNNCSLSAVTETTAPLHRWRPSNSFLCVRNYPRSI